MKAQRVSWTCRVLLLGAWAGISACAVPTASNKGAEAPSRNSPATAAANSNSTAVSNPGSIEVTSSPPGARVVLVPTGDDGAGFPQSKGVTPAVITGLAPGKYTVGLEKAGYRFYQREIEVKAGRAAKVSATLKKQ
jgi:hypothetical protein